MKDAKLSLDENSPEYLAPEPDRVVDQKILAMVADYLIPKVPAGNVLELGVGDQVWTPKLLAHCRHVATVDGSRVLLGHMEAALAGSALRERWTPEVSLFEEYAPKERFDAVAATYVLEHVEDPLRILKLARERWLRSGGTILTAVPHALSLHRRLAVKMGLIQNPSELGETDFRMEHMRCLTWTQMRDLLEQAGFRVAQYGGMFTKPLPNAMLTGLSDAQLRGLFELGTELPIEYSAAIYFLAEA